MYLLSPVAFEVTCKITIFFANFEPLYWYLSDPI